MERKAIIKSRDEDMAEQGKDSEAGVQHRTETKGSEAQGWLVFGRSLGLDWKCSPQIHVLKAWMPIHGFLGEGPDHEGSNFK